MNSIHVHAVECASRYPVAGCAANQRGHGCFQRGRDRLRVAVVFNAKDAGEPMDGRKVHGLVNLALLGPSITEGDPRHRVLSEKSRTPGHPDRVCDMVWLRTLQRDDPQAAASPVGIWLAACAAGIGRPAEEVEHDLSGSQPENEHGCQVPVVGSPEVEAGPQREGVTGSYRFVAGAGDSKMRPTRPRQPPHALVEEPGQSHDPISPLDSRSITWVGFANCSEGWLSLRHLRVARGAAENLASRSKKLPWTRDSPAAVPVRPGWGGQAHEQRDGRSICWRPWTPFPERYQP